MKFSSRKDFLFKSVVFVVCTLLLAMLIFNLYSERSLTMALWSLLVDIFLMVFLLWIFFNTNYELTPIIFKYKSGPIRGEIPINSIKEIIKGKTLWVGFKMATASKGLIIKYGKYDEIYISPNSNESFINKILELNKDIKIT